MTDKCLALALLDFLSRKERQSTYKDDYCFFLKEKGYNYESIERCVSELVHEEYLFYLAADHYWIGLTDKGRKYAKRKGRKERDVKKDIAMIASIVAIICGLIAIVSRFL